MAKGKRKSMVDAIVEKAIECLSEGDRCPRIERLMLALNGTKPKGRLYETIGRARKKLKKDHGLHACSVCVDFYHPVAGPDGREIRASFSERPPESGEEARMCLAGGRGRKIGGLYFPQACKSGDLIYEEWMLRRLNDEMKPIRDYLEQAGDAMEKRILSRRRVPNRIGNMWCRYLGEPSTALIEEGVRRALEDDRKG